MKQTHFLWRYKVLEFFNFIDRLKFLNIISKINIDIFKIIMESTMCHLTLILGLVSIMVLSGCNTVKGVGKDVQAGGQVVTEAAEKVQADM